MDSPDLASRVASRWWAAAGIGFAVLTLYALLGPPWPPRGDAPATTWQAHLASAPNRLGLLAGAVVATIGGVLFIAFMANLHRSGLLVSGGLARLGYGCGLLFVATLIVAFCAWATVPGGIQISGEPMPSGDLIRYFNDLGQALVCIPAPLCCGAFAGVIAANIRRTDVVPRWLGTAGVAVAIAQLGGMFFFPLLLFPVWIATLSVALLTRHDRLQTTSPAYPPLEVLTTSGSPAAEAGRT